MVRSRSAVQIRPTAQIHKKPMEIITIKKPENESNLDILLAILQNEIEQIIANDKSIERFKKGLRELHGYANTRVEERNQTKKGIEEMHVRLRDLAEQKRAFNAPQKEQNKINALIELIENFADEMEPIIESV